MKAPAPIVALMNWFIPGSGYLLMGQFSRGLTIGITVIVTFAIGIIIGGVHVVSPPDFSTTGAIGSVISNSIRSVLQKPWYIGQFLTGLMGLAAGYVGPTQPASHGVANEYGTLYTAVAGMFNLLGCIDSAWRASALNAEAQQEKVLDALRAVPNMDDARPPESSLGASAMAQKQGD